MLWSMFVYLLCLAYLFIWVNVRTEIKLLSRSGNTALHFLHLNKDEDQRFRRLKRYGSHFLVIIAAFCLSYAFIIKSVLLMLSSLVFWWIADDLMTKRAQRRFILETASALPKGIAPELQREILLNAIEEQKKTDPWVAAKVAANSALQKVMAVLAEQGSRVQTESLFCALGALAGFMCQLAIHAKNGDNACHLLVMTTDDGKKYYYGDALNDLLIKMPTSVWQLALATEAPVDQDKLPDVLNIFGHVAKSLGTDQFGVPRYPEYHASHLPAEYVKIFAVSIIRDFMHLKLPEAEWPVALGFAIQKALNMSRDILAAETAITIVMESAIPMSKIDLLDELMPAKKQ